MIIYLPPVCRSIASIALLTTLLCSALLGLGGCATFVNPNTHQADGIPQIVLKTTQPALNRAMVDILNKNGLPITTTNDADTLNITLQEQTSESVDSINADGTAATYKINYQLSYKIGEQETQHIKRYRIVQHDENYYHASRLQRQKTLQNFRQDALKKVVFLIRYNQP